MLGDSYPEQHIADDYGVQDGTVAVDRGAVTRAVEPSEAASHAGSGDASSSPLDPIHPDSEATSGARARKTHTGKRWWLLAAASAIVLTGLTLAGVYLVTKKPSTVDQLVILTVPSGAEIKLDSKDYGHSPVKLEQLAIGTYQLTITKEGFEPIEQSIAVTESGPVEFKLKPVLPSETVNMPAEEQIKQFQQQAEEAFAQGNFGLIYEGSALNYADLILRWESNNAFAGEMRERVRKVAHQSAQAAISRGDLAQAQEIYNFLADYYPSDEEGRIAAAKLESQLSARRGEELRDLVRKADEAFQGGHLTEPARASAYYYSKQALAIDRQNDKARQIRNQVKESLASASEQAYARGDVDAAIKQLERVAQLFPEDKEIRTRARELQASRTRDTAKASDPNARRIRGLDAYRNENWADAIADLESALVSGRGTPDVVFALARSYMKSGQFDQAASYFRKVPQTAEDTYRSSIAALGDIALQRGDAATAVERYKEARQLGGSTLYPVPNLEDKIDRIERKQREKAAEPTPLTIQARHLHGGLLGGSCSGTITINSTGVRYDGTEHTYSYTVSGVEVRVAKDEMIIQFQKDSQKFKVARSDAERFRETLARYKQSYSSTKN
jgi:thioredoxin-like negative regulator of GroEL